MRHGTVSPGWVAERLGDAKLRILDVRPPGAYAEGHLAGAVSVDIRGSLFDVEGTLVTALELAHVMSSLGVGDEHTIVLYGDGPETATVAALRAFVRYGHADVAILEGGYTRWVGERRPTTRAVPRHASASFTAKLGAASFGG